MRSPIRQSIGSVQKKLLSPLASALDARFGRVWAAARPAIYGFFER